MMVPVSVTTFGVLVGAVVSEAVRFCSEVLPLSK